MSGRLPHNLDAERSLIGSIFQRNETYFDVQEIVSQHDFYEPFHGELFALIADQIIASRNITPTTALHDISQDSDIGGVRASDYLRGLMDEGIPRAQAAEVARVVRDTSIRRRIIETGEQMIEEARSAPVSITADEIRDNYAEAFDALFPRLSDLGVLPIAQYGDAALARAVAAHRDGKPLGLDWGMAALNNLIGPALPGRLYSWAGASGAGKSALIQQVLEYICRPQGDQKYAMLVEAEMEGEELAVRSMSASTGVKGDMIERGILSDSEYAGAFESNEELRKGGLMVDAAAFPSIPRIRARAMRARRNNRLDIIAIDHILYIDKPERRMSEIEAIMPNMRSLKALAKELHVPVVVLMPLKSGYNDSVANGVVRRPHLGDVNHPAAVDVNSDAIMFVHRPEYILKRNEPARESKSWDEWIVQQTQWEGRAELVKAKQRGGDSGSWNQMVWFTDRARFRETAPSFTEKEGLPF